MDVAIGLWRSPVVGGEGSAEHLKARKAELAGDEADGSAAIGRRQHHVSTCLKAHFTDDSGDCPSVTGEEAMKCARGLSLIHI